MLSSSYHTSLQSFCADIHAYVNTYAGRSLPDPNSFALSYYLFHIKIQKKPSLPIYFLRQPGCLCKIRCFLSVPHGTFSFVE